MRCLLAGWCHSPTPERVAPPLYEAGRLMEAIRDLERAHLAYYLGTHRQERTTMAKDTLLLAEARCEALVRRLAQLPGNGSILAQAKAAGYGPDELRQYGDLDHELCFHGPTSEVSRLSQMPSDESPGGV